MKELLKECFITLIINLSLKGFHSTNNYIKEDHFLLLLKKISKLQHRTSRRSKPNNFIFKQLKIAHLCISIETVKVSLFSDRSRSTSSPRSRSIQRVKCKVI
jgi:hypothetical protein